MFHGIRLAKVVYISILAFSTRPLLPLPLPVERNHIHKTANMNQVNFKKDKNRARGLFRYRQRRASAISDYLLLAAPLQHMKAVQFIDELEQKYPGKKDVRKTPEFRLWQKNQLGISDSKTPSTATNNQPDEECDRHTYGTQQIVESRKEMVLNIQLINTAQPQEISQPIPQASVKSGPEQSEVSSIFDQIPDDVMNRMLKDINEDPCLKSILDQFDMYEETIDEGWLSDIDIDCEFPLEEELNKLL